MLFTGLGRSVWEKTVPLVLNTALGLPMEADKGQSQNIYEIRKNVFKIRKNISNRNVFWKSS